MRRGPAVSCESSLLPRSQVGNLVFKSSEDRGLRRFQRNRITGVTGIAGVPRRWDRAWVFGGRQIDCLGPTG